MQDSDGNRTDYQYDRVSRLISIWAANYDYVSFTYDAGGRLTERLLSNGVDAKYTYNPDNTLASLANKAGTTAISNHVYSYDVLGNRATQAETVGATTINYTYGYDNLNRLTQVQNGTATQQENYSYDPLDNRTSKSVGATAPTVTAYVYDAGNQLKEIHSGSATGTLLASLTYDVDGNLKGRSDTGLALTYDPLNRLIQATIGGQTQSYVYDDQGRRIQKTVAGIPTNMLYNGPDIVAEYGPTWGLPLAQYTQGPKIDDPIIRATATAAQYYHQDGLGSVVGVSNNLGGTDATQRFDAWGNKIASTGTTPHYGYTGREPDETGLIYYRARYYDPTVSRFTQRDPIGLRGGLNRYCYVGGNPVNATDPSGECPQCAIGAVIGIVWGGVNGYLAGDRGSQLMVDVLAGAGTGALAGLTGGASLVEQIAARSILSAGIEADRQYINQDINPASEINAGNMVLAGGLSVLGDSAGTAAALQKAIQDMQSLKIIVEANETIATIVGGNTSGITQIPFSILDGLKSKAEEHGGGGTVGGLPGKLSAPVAPYSGNQK